MMIIANDKNSGSVCKDSLKEIGFSVKVRTLGSACNLYWKPRENLASYFLDLSLNLTQHT